MTVRREIAEPRRETGARSPEDLRRTRAVRRRPEGRARRPKACRNSGSAIAAEVLMNHAGETRLDREGMSVRGGEGELQEGGGWKLMIFRARATRGRGLPSLDARSRRSISPHPPESEQASSEGACISFDARNKRQLGPALEDDRKEKN